MQGATFTISSLGGIGGTSFTPIINAPEVAILGVTALGHEAGLGRHGVRAAADGAAVAVLRPPGHRRRRRARASWCTSSACCRTCGGRCCERRRGQASPISATSTTSRSSRSSSQPGDTVAAEDPLVTLESDKATMDVPAPAPGSSSSLRVQIGDRVSEGSVLMTFEWRLRVRRRTEAGATPGRIRRRSPAPPTRPAPTRRRPADAGAKVTRARRAGRRLRR